MNGVVLWIAQGFGVGRIPFAPGTFGSLIGVLWLLVIIQARNLSICLTAICAGLLFSVWVCGRAESILKEKDASSIVFDELAAIPVCFVPWLAIEWSRAGRLPTAESFLQPPLLFVTFALVILFRIFDIAKVWPARLLERWPGGWGITADDLLAACYVATLSWLFVF